jgi:multidrug efflux system membrane fusion protein
MDRDVNRELDSAKSKRSTRRIIWPVAILIAVAAISFFKPKILAVRQEKNHDKESVKSAYAAIVPVSTRAAVQGDFPVYLSGLGTVTALRTVTVRSRIDGELVRVAFKEGQMVHSGDLLAEIDPRPFKAQLMQAEGQLIHDEALLKNAEIDLRRYKTLLSQDSIAAQQVATQEALVKQYRGTVETDRGLIANAKLQLDYARIVSPISGRVGLRLVDQGNMVHASDSNGLVVITQVQPIAVVFTLPEDDLPAVLRRQRSGADIFLEAYNRSGKIKLAEGRLLAVDNQIDPATGTVKLKGQFDNEDQSLFANQFVNVKMLVDVLRSVTIIPSAAIQHGAPGVYVYVVNKDRTISVRVLRLGPADGENVSVLSGLNPNEQVVIDGVDKLHEGTKVEIVANKITPAGNGTPSAQDNSKDLPLKEGTAR